MSKKKPGQLDLFLKKEGVYNIDGDKVKPEDLEGYYKDKYLSYNHDDVEYKNRDNLAKGIKAKKLLGLKLSEKDKNFKSNKEIKAIREKEIIKEKAIEKKRIEERKKIIQKHKESRGIRTNTKLQQKIAKELEKAKKIGSKVMPKKLKILKSLLIKNKNTKPKPPTKKKSGGRLNDGTAFKKSLYSKAKDQIKKLDITKKMPESLKKNPIRKALSKAARFGLRTATGSNPLGMGLLVGSMTLDEYNKPENKLKRLKRQKKVFKKRRTGTDRQRARHGSGVLTAAEERELDRKQKELEEVVNKYMGGSLNTTRRK